MRYIKHRINILLLLLLPIVASGCSVKFIADYDEVTDKLVIGYNWTFFRSIRSIRNL